MLHAKAHAAQQGVSLGHGGVDVLIAVAGRQAQAQQLLAVVGGDGRAPAQQQVVGQTGNIVCHLPINIGNFLQRTAVTRGLTDPAQIQFAGHEVVAHLQHHHQHAGQSLAPRGVGCFQNHIARGLQLVGQGGLALEQLAQAGGGIGIQISRLRGAVFAGRHAPRVGLQQGGDGQQQVGRHLGAVAAVQYRIGDQRIHHIQGRAQRAVEGAQQHLVRALGWR